MRLTLQATLLELRIPHNNPIAFLSYAERVRTYLFDLEMVEETGSVDIIDSLCGKLRLEDRLSWNEERERWGRVCTLGSFGSWIFRRAAGYLTDEYPAAAQRKDAGTRHTSESHHRPEKQRVHTNQAFPTPGADGTSKTSVNTTVGA